MPLEKPDQITPSSNPVAAFFRGLEAFLFKFLEFILEAIIAILTSLVKIIRATGVAVGIICIALALLLITLFYAVDLPSAENFQSSREKGLEALTNWFEVEFQDDDDSGENNVEISSEEVPENSPAESETPAAESSPENPEAAPTE